MAPKQSDSLTGGRDAWSLIRRIPLSDAVLNLCYWCTVVLVVVAWAYVFHWRWTHLVVPAVDDPWGITTPPWIADVFFLLLMSGYLAGACRQALSGNRKWNSLGIAALVMVAVGLMQKVDAYMFTK
jgi:hypothetical protein